MNTFDLPQGMTENTISLLLGHPDPSTLLTAELRASMLQVINDPQAYAVLQYGPEQGTRSLANVLVEKIRREQYLSVQPENLMLVAGFNARGRYARPPLYQTRRGGAGRGSDLCRCHSYF
jgi:DNA-binding transcriptional MocR family regulator